MSSSFFTLLNSCQVCTIPLNSGIKLIRMIADTTIAADASATSGVTDFITSAIVAAMMTAILLRVSAKTCCFILYIVWYECMSQNNMDIVFQFNDKNNLLTYRVGRAHI